MTKRTIAIVLALVLALGLATVASAAHSHYECTECGASRFYTIPKHGEEKPVGTSDFCVLTELEVPTYCINAHFFATETRSDITTGHTYGPLNADGYTRSCIDCGHTIRG